MKVLHCKVRRNNQNRHIICLIWSSYEANIKNSPVQLKPIQRFLPVRLHERSVKRTESLVSGSVLYRSNRRSGPILITMILSDLSKSVATVLCAGARLDDLWSKGEVLPRVPSCLPSVVGARCCAHEAASSMMVSHFSGGRKVFMWMLLKPSTPFQTSCSNRRV